MWSMVFLNAENSQCNRSLFDFLKTSFHTFEAVNTMSKSRSDIPASEIHQEDGL